MRQLVIGIGIVTLLISCGQRPKIDYKETLDTASVVDDRIRDTTKILVSNLPIKFDSTDVLIFAVGLVDLRPGERYEGFQSGSYGNTNASSSYFTQDFLSGNFINLVFQDKEGNERRLTDKKLVIRNVNFLRGIFEKTKRGYLLYSLADRDSNGDKELNQSDLKALYISRIDGTDFKKISKELHEFYDYNQIKGEDRIYFKTLEDKNKDGELNNKDKFHYYYIDFSNDNYVVTEHNPLKIFE